ncbi:MAG: dGTP triphosphohydrolase [Bryobacteraceae bacterium]
MRTSPIQASLATLCFPVPESRGRRYPELPHPYRNDFQHDRDRIIHARAFRRLEDKTQVFTPGLSDHFRNRLTHTIEVAQIARTVAAVLGLEEDLTEALALGHDVGHPPFAHAGEDELDRQMRRFGDGFDHNLHSLRIVESFEQRYARFPGLNLTFEVREGIAKHSRDFEPGEFPELDEYLPGLRPPLEAQLIDLADEIAYNTADLDDGFSARLFSVAQIVEEVPHYREMAEGAEFQFGGASERTRFQESLRALVDHLVTGLIEGTHDAASKAGVRDVNGVRRHPERLAALTEPARETNSGLKKFLHAHVYGSELLAAERTRCAQMVAELFQFFVENPQSLPENYETSGLTVHRAACDYIAGMTDGYFRRVHQQMLGQERRS